MDCNGELFEPSSNHNLAKEEFDDVWASDIFDMRAFDDGYCHTYNPPNKTTSNFKFRLGLFLGHSAIMKRYQFYFFSLFVHEKDQFWPRKCKSLGRTYHWSK